MTDIEITAAPEPRVVFRKRYACPFCRFQRSTEKPVIEHIERCWSDPAKRTCKTCTHFERARRVLEPLCPCGCNDSVDECALGETLPEKAPVVDCPLWRDRNDEEDAPAEDDVTAGLRGLLAVDGGDQR
jgi:hypothetical protein